VQLKDTNCRELIPITPIHKPSCKNSMPYSQWYPMKRRRAMLSVKISNHEYPVRDTDASAQRASVLHAHDNRALGF